MSAVPATTTPPAESKALILLGDDRVAVRLDAEGYLTRVQTRARLAYGTELYAAVRGTPSDTDKVQPYQPGYMRLVHAMGGQLLCPPTVRDPVTGAARPNPLVETWPDGTVRRVTATALCAVRNPLTGEWVVTTQTIVQDLETVLRQALLKMAEHEEVVQIMAPDEWEGREREKYRGWMAVPLAGAVLACNLRKPGVRDAWGTLLQQAATARQRACSKAERLAADHNPVTRRTWYYGQLKRDGNSRYVEVACVAWIEHRGRDEMARWLEQLATAGRADGVEEVIDLDPVDVSEVGDPDDEVPVEDLPLIEDKPEPEVVPAKAADPVPAAAAPSPDLDKLRTSCVEWADQVTPEQLRALQEQHGCHDVFAVTDPAVLRTFRKALQDAAERGAR